MKLDPIDWLRIVSYGGKWGSLRLTNDVEIFGKILELVSMGHPNLLSRSHPGNEGAISCYEKRERYLHFITQTLEERVDS